MNKIRLHDKQIDSIKELAKKLFNSQAVWIFGSRADINQRGGDIDIYLQTDKKDNILQTKIIFLREFDKKFSEQKVDLLVDNHTVNKEIFNIARKTGLRL